MLIIRDYCRERSRRYNAVLNCRRTSDGEIISLATAKLHLKVDFTDDDTLITELITDARQAIEQFTGLSLVPTSVVAILQNPLGNIDLPYGPVIEDSVTLINDDGTEDTGDWKLTGLDFPALTTAYDSVRVEYNAGYDEDTLPGDLRRAILRQLTELYQNRGDGKLSESAKALAKPYQKGTCII
jgi:uncharacterized phiE125 gp8 family phage protein